MAEPPECKEEYEFPPFHLDVTEGVLLREGRRVTITPKAVSVLAVLIRRRPGVVSADVFQQEVWGGLSVSKGNLQTQILTARKALGKFGDTYIRNVPGEGYRFAGRVLAKAVDMPGEQAEAIAEPGGEPVTVGDSTAVAVRRAGLGRTVAVVSMAALAIIAVSAFFLHGSRAAATGRTAIAVLDFRDLGDSEDAWIGTAAPVLLRTEMEAGKRLRAIPAESVNRMLRELPIRETLNLDPATLLRIRKDVGADLVLVGTYLEERNSAGGAVRFDISVLDTRSGATVATLIETGSAANLLDLIGHIGDGLRAKLSEPELAAKEQRQLRAWQPGRLEALEFYAKGLTQMKNFNAKEARSLFEKALQSDGRFVLARVALADAWLTLGFMGKAKEEARRAYEAASDVPREQALWIEGRYRQLLHEWPRAIEVYQSLLTFSQDNVDYGLALANAQVADLKGADALKTIVRMRSLSDDPRVDLAEAQAFEATGNFKGELAAARVSETKALERGARLLAAAAQLRQAWALDNLGQFQAALDVAAAARRAYAEAGDRGGEAAALKNMADVQGDWAKLDEALRGYENILVVFHDLGQEARVAMTLNSMAYLYKEKGDLGGAQRLFQQSADLGREIGDKSVEAMGLNGMAIILWRQGQIAQAKEKYQKAFLTFQEAGDRSRAAACVNNFAIALQDLGNLQEARQFFETSLAEYREIGDEISVARELGNLGEILTRLGDLQEAEADLREQLAIGKKLAEAKQTSYALFALAELYLIKDELNQARRSMEESLAIRRSLGEKGLVAESEAERAEILAESGQYTEAEQAAREAISEFEREQEVDEEAAAWGAFSRILLLSGKTTDAASAAATAVKLGGQSEDRQVRASVKIAAGRVYAAQGRREEAKTELSLALSEAHTLEDAPLVFDAELALAELGSKSRGNAETAALADLEREARMKGFLLAANRAGSLEPLIQSRVFPAKE